MFVACGIAWYGLRYEAPVYFDENEFVAIRQKIKENPDNISYKEKFRCEDKRHRELYFDSVAKLRFGVYLLLGGILSFTLLMRRFRVLTEKLPVPVPPAQKRNQGRDRGLQFISVLVVSISTLATVFMGLHIYEASREPPQKKELPLTVVKPVIEKKTVPENLKWPLFRGPGGMGIVTQSGFPLNWDATKNENILWKTALILPGNSSPVVWGDRIFLTGAGGKDREVHCFNRETGSLIWTYSVRVSAQLGDDFKPYKDTGLAASTPATDGENVYALFGTGELVAIDFSGKPVWSRWFGEPKSAYGLAASLLIHNKKLIVQLDQGSAKDSKSFIYALNPDTGRDIWKTPRAVANSWSTPVIAKTPTGDQIITCADPWVISYDPEKGQEIWKANVLSGDVAPLPVYFGGVVYTLTQYSMLSAIKTDGQGDVSDTKVVWRYEENLPDVPSPVTDGEFFLMATGEGLITCLDARDGKMIWQNEHEEGFWSSPSLIGRNVFLTDKKGTTIIFELTDNMKITGSGKLGEQVVTTPAFVDSKIYIRGESHLFCIGFKDQGN